MVDIFNPTQPPIDQGIPAQQLPTTSSTATEVFDPSKQPANPLVDTSPSIQQIQNDHAAEKKIANQTTGDLIGTAQEFGSEVWKSFKYNTTVGKFAADVILSSHDVDPNWTDQAREDFIKAHNISPEDQPQYKMSTSPQEAQERLAYKEQSVNDMRWTAARFKYSPVSTFIASSVGTFADIDTVVAGGLTKFAALARAAKAAEAAEAGGIAAKVSRIDTAIEGAATGGASLGVSQLAADAVDPLGTAKDGKEELASVLGAVVSGAAFNGAFGYIMGGKAKVKGEEPPKPEAGAPKPEPVAPEPGAPPEVNIQDHINTAAVEATETAAVADKLPWTKENPNGQKPATQVVGDPHGTLKAEADLDVRRQAEVDADKAKQSEAAAAQSESTTGTFGPKPQVFDPRDVELAPADHADGLASSDPFTTRNSSAGAAQTGANPNLHAQNSFADNTDLQAHVAEADAFNAQHDIMGEYHQGPMANAKNPNSPIVKIADKFWQMLTNTPGLKTDYDKLMRSGSSIAAGLAYRLFDNASGLLRNNASAAGLKGSYLNTLLGGFRDPWADAYNAFANQKGVGPYKAVFRGDLKEEFNREVWQEMSGRFHDGAAHQPHFNPHVISAADILDRYFAGEIPILKGMSGEFAVHGSDTLTAKSGFMPHRWDANKIIALINSNPTKTRQPVVDAIAASIQRQNPMLLPDQVEVWARAVVDNATRRGASLTASPSALFSTGGVDAIRDFLKRNNASDATINGIIDVLSGKKADAGKLGTLKHRIDIDPRSSFNGISMLDLLETDIPKLVMHRAHGVAGTSALARIGIRSVEDRDRIISHILLEQQHKEDLMKSSPTDTDKLSKFAGGIQDWLDSHKKVDRATLEDMFTAFTPNADAINGVGAIGANHRRMVKVANLLLLNQNGLAQLAETGPLIAQAGGWSRFLQHAGDAFQSELRNKHSALIGELKFFNTMVHEEMLHDPTMFDNMTPDGDMGGTLDKYLNAGMRGQGWWSGMFHVRRMQHNIAVASMTDRIMRNLAGYANDLSPQRLKDMGLSEDMWKSTNVDPNYVGPQPRTMDTIRKYIENGTIEFMDQDGNKVLGKAPSKTGVVNGTQSFDNIRLHKLNMDKWHGAALQDFRVAINRAANLNVQRAMAGESNSFMAHNGIASLFMHLKSYPALAIQKQFVRQISHGDSESRHILLSGLVTAAVAYTVKQVVNDNTENLTPMGIGKGAFNMSNAFGWIPMMTDPVAGMLGMPQFQMNNYYTNQKDIIGAPAAYTIANTLLRSPGAIGHSLGHPFGLTKFTNDDARTLKVLLGPVAGIYGASGLYNGLMYNSK